MIDTQTTTSAEDIVRTSREARIQGLRHGRQVAAARLAALAADAAEHADAMTAAQSYDLRHAMLLTWAAIEREDLTSLALDRARGVVVVTSDHLAERLAAGDLRSGMPDSTEV